MPDQTPAPTSTPAAKSGGGKELTAQQRQFVTIRDLLMRNQQQIAMALPKHLTVDRMIRVALTAANRTPDLLNCTPLSFVGAIMQSAQLGLEPDGVLGHAWLIPFRNNKNGGVQEVQFIPGYKGLIDLAHRSGRVTAVFARLVKQNDKFHLEYGMDDDELVHEPTLEGDPGPVRLGYGLVRFKGGGYQFEPMTLAEIQRIQDFSKGASRADSPWKTHWDEMAKKTCIRRVCKTAPLSPEIQRANALDDLADSGESQRLEDLGMEVVSSNNGTTIDLGAHSGGNGGTGNGGAGGTGGNGQAGNGGGNGSTERTAGATEAKADRLHQRDQERDAGAGGGAPDDDIEIVDGPELNCACPDGLGGKHVRDCSVLKAANDRAGTPSGKGLFS